MENKLVTAYTLALVGAALQGVAGLFIVYMVAFIQGLCPLWENLCLNVCYLG